MITPGSGPLVSVVMLVYNHEDYVAEAMASVLAQDLREGFELIVADDASTDSSATIIEKYRRARPDVVRVLSTTQNLGIHDNHQRALLASRGDCVAFCEGDDYWTDPHKLRRQVDYLRSHPEHVGVHTDFDHQMTRDGGSVLRRSYAITARRVQGSTSYPQLLRRNLIQTCTLMLRRAAVHAFAESEFSACRFAVEDWPMCLHATSEGKDIGFLPHRTAVYRKADGSFTNSGHRSQMRRIEDQHRMLYLAGQMLRADPAAERAGHVATDVALLLNALHADDAEMIHDPARRLRLAGGPPRLVGTAALVLGRQRAARLATSLGLKGLLAVRDRRKYR